MSFALPTNPAAPASRASLARPSPLRRHRFAGVTACGCGHPLIPWIQRRVAMDLAMRGEEGGASVQFSPPSAAGSALGTVPAAHDTAPAAQQPLVLTNLRLFDGRQTVLQQGLAVRIEGNRVAAVLSQAQVQDDARRLDCGGRVLMPGLIDAHWHSLLCGITQTMAMAADVPYLHLVAAHEAQRTLMRGFTTVRDAGGPSFALKLAIDQGLVAGPRIYPSGAMISQTSGHGDFRLRHELLATPGRLGHAERAGVASIANGVPEVLCRVREQLMLGASQIKLMVGGGVASPYDPLASLQFTEDEIRAGVAAARDWGTYVMAHVYTAEGIRRAVRAGVQSVEHGQLADEDTVRLMADEGVWWSLQPFLADEDANQYPTNPHARADQVRVAQGTVRAYELAERFGVKTAWGTDILFNPQLLDRHGAMLAKLTRFRQPLEVLRMATGSNGELLGLSGLRNPYGAQLGAIETGALADLLVVDGDPEHSLEFLLDPQANLRLIMKDGRVCKDTLSGG